MIFCNEKNCIWKLGQKRRLQTESNINFLNMERTWMCSLIGKRIRTSYFWLRTIEHRTSNIVWAITTKQNKAHLDFDSWSSLLKHTKKPLWFGGLRKFKLWKKNKLLVWFDKLEQLWTFGLIDKKLCFESCHFCHTGWKSCKKEGWNFARKKNENLLVVLSSNARKYFFTN